MRRLTARSRRPRRRNPESTKGLAASIVAGVFTAIITAFIVDALAKARDKANRPVIPQLVAPGQSSV